MNVTSTTVTETREGRVHTREVVTGGQGTEEEDGGQRQSRREGLNQ